MLNAVSPIGRRGWSSGGQITAEPRMIVNAEMKPAKNMSSVITKISIASTALGTSSRRFADLGGSLRRRGSGATKERFS